MAHKGPRRRTSSRWIPLAALLVGALRVDAEARPPAESEAAATEPLPAAAAIATTGPEADTEEFASQASVAVVRLPGEVALAGATTTTTEQRSGNVVPEQPVELENAATTLQPAPKADSAPDAEGAELGAEPGPRTEQVGATAINAELAEEARSAGGTLALRRVVQLLFFAYSFAGLALGADHLCNSMETLCVRNKIPEDVGGASFMAFGSAIPEITVNAISTYRSAQDQAGARRSLFDYIATGSDLAANADSGATEATIARADAYATPDVASPADLGVGGILGSGFIAFLLIPSLCISFSPRRARGRFLLLRKTVLQRDISFYAVALLILNLALWKRQANLLMSIALLVVYTAYMCSLLRARWRGAAGSGANGESFISTEVSAMMVDAENLEDDDVVIATGGRIPSPEYEVPLQSPTEEGAGFISVDSSMLDRTAAIENASTTTASSASTSDYNLMVDDAGAPSGASKYAAHYAAPTHSSGTALSAALSSTTPPPSRQISIDPSQFSSASSFGPPLHSERRMRSATLFQHLRIHCTALLRYCVAPLHFALDNTCPDCRAHQPNEKYYYVTFLVSFAWISLFSYFITDISCDWVDAIGVPSLMAFAGLCLVATGAEIPDAVNSVTVAKRGLGSMATSACLGSQIANICLGLGLSWGVACVMSGEPVEIGRHDFLIQFASKAQVVNVGVFYVASCVFSARPDGSVVLGKKHVALFGVLYLLWMGVFAKIALGAKSAAARIG